MCSCRCDRRELGRVLIGVLPVLLCANIVGGADSLPAPKDAAAKPALTLQACRQIALEQQPSIAAMQAGLKAAIDRANAIDNLHVPGFLARDLPIRRKQSALGSIIAQGGVTQAESETLYGVTYSYLGALYAAQQYTMANKEIRDRLDSLNKLVSDAAIRKSRRDVILEEHANLVTSFLHTLDGRQQQAVQGRMRALAALREAMGVGPEFAFDLPKRDLPCPRVQPNLEELTALALARRGELIQVNTFAQVVCLEIDAQASSCRPNMRTFASGSDIHAKPIPAGNPGGIDYRPAAVGPEMPASLTGSRAARVEQARDYHQRAEAAAVKTRNLVALEVEDLYRRWQEKATRAMYLEKAYRESLKFSEKMKQSFKPRIDPNDPKTANFPNIDEVINAGLVTTRLQLEWKEAHYESLLALAALERATAGGFCVDFDAAPACEAEARAADHRDTEAQRRK